jgi:hypothetical protein
MLTNLLGGGTDPNAFGLPPELLALLGRPGAPGAGMANGLLNLSSMPGANTAPPAGGPAPQGQPMIAPAQAPAPSLAMPPAPLSSTKATLLSAGGAMLSNSGTSLGRSLGAGVQSGLNAFVATKDAEADRAMQQRAVDAYSKSLDNPALLKYFSPEQISVLKNMPVAQGQKILTDIGFQKPSYAASDGRVYDQTTGRVTSEKPVTPPATVNPGEGVLQANGTYKVPIAAKPDEAKPDAAWSTAVHKNNLADVPETQWTPAQRAQVWADANAFRKSGAASSSVEVKTGDSIAGQAGARLTELTKGADEAKTALEGAYAAHQTLQQGINTGPQGRAKQFVGNLLVSSGLSNDPSVTATQQYIGQTVQLLAPMMKGSGLQRFNQREFDAYKQAAANDLNFTPQALDALLTAVGKASALKLQDHAGRVAKLAGQNPDMQTLWGVSADPGATAWATGKAAGPAPVGQWFQHADGKYYRQRPDGKYDVSNSKPGA